MSDEKVTLSAEFGRAVHALHSLDDSLDKPPAALPVASTVPSDLRAFLDRLDDEPGDDATSLVLADWLQERADEARATYIRTSVELGKCGSKPRELFVADGAGNRLEGLGVAMIPRGGGHYSASSLERGLSTETFMPNERVDIYAHLARKDRVGWIRGLKYVKHVPERDEIIFRKDAQSGPWKGREFGTRLSALLAANPGWTSLPCPGCDGKVKLSPPVCVTCRNVGDLARQWMTQDEPSPINGTESRITPALDCYARGVVPFVRSVECQTAEVCRQYVRPLCVACQAGRHDHCGKQVPAAGSSCGCDFCWGADADHACVTTDWAVAVVDGIGTLQEFRVKDKRPLKMDGFELYRWCLWDGRHPEVFYELPAEVMSSLPHGPATVIRDDYHQYDSETAAWSALGKGLYAFVKGKTRKEGQQ